MIHFVRFVISPDPSLSLLLSFSLSFTCSLLRLNTTLRILVLSGNPIGAAGAVAFAKALKYDCAIILEVSVHFVVASLFSV
jgi:hypothetical protein